MRIILLGSPGAGKGTLSTLIKEKFEVAHVSTGDILREEMKSNSDLGQQVKNYVDSGELVPDSVIIKLIENKFKNDSSLDKGFILDGFPRTTSQAEDLDKMLSSIDKSIEYVFYLSVDLPVILRRLTGRRICRKCGAIYHTINMPPKQDGVCDLCGGELYQRADDNEETIKTRMDVYMNNTAPIIDHYEKQGKLRNLDGNQDAKDLIVTILKMWEDDEKNNQDKN